MKYTFLLLSILCMSFPLMGQQYKEQQSPSAQKKLSLKKATLLTCEAMSIAWLGVVCARAFQSINGKLKHIEVFDTDYERQGKLNHNAKIQRSRDGATKWLSIYFPTVLAALLYTGTELDLHDEPITLAKRGWNLLKTGYDKAKKALATEPTPAA